MADTASSGVKAEPVSTITSSNETEPATAPAQKTNDVGTSTSDVAPPAANATPSTRSGPVMKGSQHGLHLDANTEKHVREVMAQARKVANGGDNPFTSEEDIKDLAVVTNNLVQLLNAAYIATDTIVRGVGYMQGESRPHPKTALAFARRDRRAQLDQQQAAGQGLTSTTNLAVTEKDGKEITESTNISHDTEVTGSNNENAAPAIDGQQQNSTSSQAKPKKKRFWHPRRNSRKGKNNVNPKSQENKVEGQTDGAAEDKESGDSKATATLDKPQTSGSDTAAEEMVEGNGELAAAKA